MHIPGAPRSAGLATLFVSAVRLPVCWARRADIESDDASCCDARSTRSRRRARHGAARPRKQVSLVPPYIAARGRPLQRAQQRAPRRGLPPTFPCWQMLTDGDNRGARRHTLSARRDRPLLGGRVRRRSQPPILAVRASPTRADPRRPRARVRSRSRERRCMRDRAAEQHENTLHFLAPSNSLGLQLRRPEPRR